MELEKFFEGSEFSFKYDWQNECRIIWGSSRSVSLFYNPIAMHTDPNGANL